MFGFRHRGSASYTYLWASDGGIGSVEATNGLDVKASAVHFCCSTAVAWASADGRGVASSDRLLGNVCYALYS